MKIKLVISVFILAFSSAKSQTIKLYYENIENGYIFKADNDEYSPISAKINFKLKNLKPIKGNNKIFVIPARTKGFELTQLKVIKKGKKYGVSSNNSFNYGDHNKISYDKNFSYELPFEIGKQYKISQGYNGSFSHQGESALDFEMPVGTNITAARSGIVVKVVDKNNRGCSEEKCKEFNNVILIYHDDGTFADYSHIKFKGSKVKVGDTVKRGQIIAESGNVGWSTAPHLHFVVFKQKIGSRQTLPTKFNVNGKTIYLKEKEVYKKL